MTDADPDPERRLRAVATVCAGLAVALLVGLGPAGGEALAGETDLSVSGDREDGDAGGTVTVSYTLANDGPNESVAPVVQVTNLPQGWEVVDQSSTAAWRPDAREWLWLNLSAGETASAALTLRIPEDADSGEYEIPVRAFDADGNAATGSATVVVGRGLGLNPGVLISFALLAGFLAWIGGYRFDVADDYLDAVRSAVGATLGRGESEGDEGTGPEGATASDGEGEGESAHDESADVG